MEAVSLFLEIRGLQLRGSLEEVASWVYVLWRELEIAQYSESLSHI
jgi:hypothetical protein